MSDEIELVSDDDGVVVVGDEAAVVRFLDQEGLADLARTIDPTRLGKLLRAGADLSQSASTIVERSGRYLKLTPESAKRLKDAGGLMPTKTKGISHAMLGETGKKSLKWLQVENGSASMLTNPAVLSGVGGLMSQFAQQAEAEEFRALVERMDQKLDDVRRAQRDAVLARLKGAAAAIDEAMEIHAAGGDPRTLWVKVSGEAGELLTVQDETLLALQALADKVVGTNSPGALKKLTREVEGEVAVHLAVLARSFELQDLFRVVELDYVAETAPERLDGHRVGLANAAKKRRAGVLDATARLMAELGAAGVVANANTILHVRAARSVVGSLNSTGAVVDDFHIALGVESAQETFHATPWRQAMRNADQLKKAGIEVGKKAGTVAMGVAGIVATAAVVREKSASDS